MRTKHTKLYLAAYLMCGLATAQAVVVTTNGFSVDPGADVSARDGYMEVVHDGGNSYMVGTFPGQDFPSPETDAFQITLADFMGNYTAAGITQIAFDLFAVNVAPSDLFLRITDGVNVFSYQFMSLAGITTTFTTFTASLVYSAGWVGVGETEFNNALASITAIEIELTRSGSGTNIYQLDNLATAGAGGGGGGPSAIPEPNVVNLLLFVGVLIVAFRRLRFAQI